MKNTFVWMAFCLASFSAFAQKKLTRFKTGDRIVFAGNSITETGLYESYIWLYYMTHFPNERIDILNGGIGGDVAGQIYARFEGDIIAKKPNILAVTFGMNDSKYFEYMDKGNLVDDIKRNAIIKESSDSYSKIETELKKRPNITPIIIASSPYDETVKMDAPPLLGKAKTMRGIIGFQLASARKNNWGFVDFFNPMTEINLREQQKNPGYTNTGTDRIHPGSAGHFIMAYIFLKAQGLTNTPVADVKIDANTKKIIKSTNAVITNIKAGPNQMSFDYLARSLPYPIDTVPRVWQNFQKQTEALEVIPFIKEFDQEVLTVAGLKAGTYLLKIDGNDIGKWSGADFSMGINLATVKNTPQYQQALKILGLNNDRRGIEGKYRNFYWVQYNFLKGKNLLFDKSGAARDTIENTLKTNPKENGWLNAKKGDYDEIMDHGDLVKNKMVGIVNQIYSINKPLNRHIEIIKTSK